MIDLPELLLLVGSVGWFLFTYLAALGEKGALRTLLWTLFYWLLSVDPIAIVGGMIWPLARQHIAGLHGLLFFVLLPYVLSGLRIYWLRNHPRRAIEARPKPRASTLSLGILLLVTGAVMMSWKVLGLDEPRIMEGVPAGVVGALVALIGACACSYAISKRRKRNSPAPAR